METNRKGGGGVFKNLFPLDWTGFWENVCIFKVDLRDKKRKKRDWGEHCKLMFLAKKLPRCWPSFGWFCEWLAALKYFSKVFRACYEWNFCLECGIYCNSTHNQKGELFFHSDINFHPGLTGLSGKKTELLFT